MYVPIKSDSLIAKLHPDLTKAERLLGIWVNDSEFNKYLEEAKTTVPHLSTEEQRVWAIYNAHRHPGKAIAPKPMVQSTDNKWLTILQIAIIVLLLLLLCGVKLHAEPIEYNVADDYLAHLSNHSLFPQIVTSQGIVNDILKIGGVAPTFNGGSLNVSCTSGCSASAGFSDNSAFTVGSTTINIIGGYYTTGAAPTLSSGNAARARIDASSYLFVDCAVGCSGSSFSDNTGFTAGSTPISITGGWYSTSPTACTSGSACAPSLTSDRKMFVQDFQGTSPWVVSASGNFGVTQQTSPWVVSLASTTITGTVAVTQSTSPWVDSCTAANCTVVANAGTGTFTVGGTVTANAGTGQFNVTCTVTNCPVSLGNDEVTENTTTAPTKVVVVGGETNDATAQYDSVPLGAGGRSLIVEGFAGGTAVPVSGTFFQATQPVSCATAATCPVNASEVGGPWTTTDAADGSTGSAVPSKGIYAAGNGSGNLTGIVTCDNSTAINFTGTALTQVIAISGTGGRTYICHYDLVVAAADNVNLVSGSGTNCASNQAGLLGGTTAATGLNFAANGGISSGSGIGMIIKTAATNNEVCITSSASSTQVSGVITWTQF